MMRGARILLVSFTLSVLVNCLMPLPGTAEDKYTVKLGHCNDPNPQSIFHVVALKLEELTEEYTDGKVQVDVYPAFQLGSETEQVRGCQLGTQEATLAGTNNVNPFIPPLQYLTLPYIIDTIEEGRNVIDAMWDKNNEWATEQGLRILVITDAGFRVLSNSKKPVTKLSDLRGLKIRVPENPVQLSAFKSWGIDPVPMSWSETFNALQQGVIDGQENPYNVLVAQKFYEVQKYVTEIDYIFQTGMIVMSEKFFQGLPKDLQEAVVKAGRDTTSWERDLSDKTLESDKAFLRDKGMVLSGRPEDMEEWIKRARGIWPQFYKMIGNGNEEEGQKVVELVKKCKSAK